MTRLKLFVIAGEPSGDRLGAALLARLRAEVGDTLEVTGVGGPLMQAEGLESLFPMDRLSVMGLAEVLPRIPEILGLIRRTADAAIAASPAALITIDSPDFCLRVAKRVRAAAPGVRTIHYVAPSVWAWRPGRAAKMARVIDHVLALLPFEPPYMTAAGMTCDFVGHPAAHVPQAGAEEVASFRAAQGLAPEQPVLCLLPGSRAGEVARHGPVFADALKRLRGEHPGLGVVLPAVGARMEALSGLFPDVDILDPRDMSGAEAEHRKRVAFAASNVALAVSGTVSLEVAAAGTPMVVAYKANPLSAFLAKRLVKVRHASLINILEDRAVIPEYLFERATPGALAGAVSHLLTDAAAREGQTTGFAHAMAELGRGGPDPGLRAARSVLAAIG